MGSSILERGVVIKGTPVVQLGDDLFWFNRPGLILLLIHFVLFQNAFQLAFFVWSWYQFGYPSCYIPNLEEMIIRIAMGVLVQVLCSYVTLPLYALVTQMGSSIKPVIFSEQVESALRTWHQTARKRIKEGRQSGSTTQLHGGLSPVHLLHGHQSGGGGEGTSASGSRLYIDHTRHCGEEERDVEEYSLKNQDQLEVQISLRDFSFRNMYKEERLSGSK